MKTIIFYFFLIISASLLYGQSSIVYDAGTIIEIGTSADVCAGTITINGGYSGNGRFCNGTVEVGSEEDTKVPKEFSLSQNYPNPFNPVTIISYQLPESGFVTLKIYDILGNEVEILINEEKPAGSYDITFDASNLPSGIYYYKLTSGSFVETKKMVLLK